MTDRPNYITPAGYRRLREEYEALFSLERPRLVETIAWAAANGDRSENGDYIYGRRKLREIDRRIDWLSRRMKNARVTDPAAQPDRDRVWFGATVTLVGDDEEERVVTLVGEDEAEAGTGRISWTSPLGRAVRSAVVGDVRRVALPAGEREYEVVAIDYPERPRGSAPGVAVVARGGDQSGADLGVGKAHVAVVIGIAAEPGVRALGDLLVDPAVPRAAPAGTHDDRAFLGLGQPRIEQVRAGPVERTAAAAVICAAFVAIVAFAAAIVGGAAGERGRSRQAE